MIPNHPNTFNDNTFNDNTFNNQVDELFRSSEIQDKPTKDDFINSLKTIIIDENTNNLTCCICQDIFKPGDTIIKLPCKDKPHYFHKGVSDECDGIIPWLKTHNNCPICRTEFPHKEISTQTSVENESRISNNQVMEDNTNIIQNQRYSTPNQNQYINMANIINTINLFDHIQESTELDIAIQRSLDEQ